MNYSTRRFALDLHKAQSQISIAAFRNDTAVKLSILITDGGSPYRFEEGVIAVLWGTKEDGKPISHSCSIEESTRIIYEFNETTTDDVGVIDCQIRFYKGGEQILSAPKFSIVVSERIGNDDEIESYEYEDEEYGKYFAQQFSSLDEIFTKESARVTAEEARDFAEKARDTAEKARVEAEIKREEAYAQVDAKIEGKLDKTTLANRIYGTKSDKSQTAYLLDKNATANSIPQRTPTGQLRVQLAPENDDEATSKKYVIGLVNPLEERVSDLESLTLTHFVEEHVSYKQNIPTREEGMGAFATIKSIGGASKFVPGKNKLDPRTIKVLGKGTNRSVSYTVDDSGDISFELTESEEEFGVNIYFGASYFTPAKYGMYIDNVDAGDYRDAAVGAYINDVSNEIYFEVSKPEGEQYPNRYPDYYKFTIRLMIYKIEDSDTLEFVDMTESLLGDAYEKYRLEVVKADIPSIDSIHLESSSRNELNPQSIEFASWGGPLDSNSFTIYPDGSILFTVPAYDMWYATILLEPGVYRYKFVGTANGETISSVDGPDVVLYKLEDRIEINFSAQSAGYEDEETGEWREDSIDTDYNIKFMLYKESDSGYVELQEAPADVVYEPYDTREVVVDSVNIPPEVLAMPEYSLGFIGRDDTRYTNKLTFVDKTVSISAVCGIRILDGTETWSKLTYSPFAFQLDDAPPIPYIDVLTSEYKSIDLHTAQSSSENGMVTDGRTKPLIKDKNFSTAVEFKQHLAESPLIVIYAVDENRASKKDVTKYFTEDNLLKISGAEKIRFTNAEEFEVENTIAYTIRKE